MAEDDGDGGDLHDTRASYDATAGAYLRWIGAEIGPATEGPLDRAMLAGFTELVKGSAGVVGDLGCGPGRVASLLAAHRIDVVAVDLSPAMLAEGRAAHPAIPFAGGALHALPLAAGSLAGAVCWYSIINTPPDALAAVCAELRRVLAGEAPLLVAFQAGRGEAVHRTEIEGTPVSLTSYRHDPDRVARALAEVGLATHARLIRDAELEHEATPQAVLLARAGAASERRP